MSIINDDFLDALAARFDTELRAIVPDLSQKTPLYIVWESRLPFAVKSRLGHVNESLDLIANAAGAIDWHGRGPAMLLCDATLAELVDNNLRDEPDIGIKRRIFATKARAIMLHEAAHVIEFGLLEPQEDKPTEFVHARAAWFKVHAESSERIPTPDHMEVHGIRFIRILIHLCHRVGGDIESTLTNARPVARLHTPAEQYRAALGNEPARLRFLTFAEILNIKPPAAFSETFSADMGRIIADLIKDGPP